MAVRLGHTVGEEIPPLSVPMTRELIRAFGEMADDRNPVHFDDAFAQSRGFPAAIAHGAIPASFLLRMLTAWLGAWPIERDDLAITFIGPTLVGDVVTARGVVEAVADDALVCDVWCENQRGQKLIAGKARVAARS